MSKDFKIFLILFFFLSVVLLLYKFVLTPNSIAGDDVGKYSVGDTVFFTSKKIHNFFRPLKKGDVILFKRPDMEMNGTAAIVDLPNSPIDENIILYDFSSNSNTEIKNIVPEGYYVIWFENSGVFRAIPEENILGVALFSLNNFPGTGEKKAEKNVTFEYSEGNCLIDSQCKWAGDGCGGGHGLCTNQPEKHQGASICDINHNFPANQGYTCGCVQLTGKCGWEK